MKDVSIGSSDCFDTRIDGVMTRGDEELEDLGPAEDGEPEFGYVELSENEVILKFSATLMSRLKRTAYDEGIEIDELAAELITESLAQRAAQDAQRGSPSHLMTRTGYVPPDANGNVAQPFLSHHQNGNHGQGRPGQQRRPHNNRRNQQRGNRGGGGNVGRSPMNQGGGRHRGR